MWVASGRVGEGIRANVELLILRQRLIAVLRLQSGGPRNVDRRDFLSVGRCFLQRILSAPSYFLVSCELIESKVNVWSIVDTRSGSIALAIDVLCSRALRAGGRDPLRIRHDAWDRFPPNLTVSTVSFLCSNGFLREFLCTSTGSPFTLPSHRRLPHCFVLLDDNTCILRLSKHFSRL